MSCFDFEPSHLLEDVDELEAVGCTVEEAKEDAQKETRYPTSPVPNA